MVARHGYALRLFGVFLYILLSIFCVGTAERTAGGSNINLAGQRPVARVLLLIPRWRWAFCTLALPLRRWC